MGRREASTLEETRNAFHKPGRNGIGRVIDATRNSWRGIRRALATEEAFRQELALFVVMLPLALWLGDSGVERAILALPLFVVLLAEMANTAIEAIVDRFGPEHHPLAGLAKDLGSAMVFTSLLTVVTIWSVVLAGKWL